MDINIYSLYLQKTSSTLKSGRTKLTAEQQMAQTLATRNTNFSEIYTEATSTECI
ncbi:hypothetical protein CCYN49044_120007 [Capnocytophaga cynodegmi]|uniref:Uncharacterized protein n=1 Tax=Capnocytophaga cynodegmi TaxID=28189 RepID=A0A0B7HLR5_9FLAO|nr:hypothetical protein CCYN49044_120007 [Capnocytophaga cynodegmi]CEN38478.1 hypothetical protein CCYN74_30173 [Capnocytophaga cynodegmi]